MAARTCSSPGSTRLCRAMPRCCTSTFLGGSGDEAPKGIAVDGAGNAYVSGYTASTNFPTTAGAFQASFAGGDYDAFVASSAHLELPWFIPLTWEAQPATTTPTTEAASPLMRRAMPT